MQRQEMIEFFEHQVECLKVADQADAIMQEKQALEQQIKEAKAYLEQLALDKATAQESHNRTMNELAAFQRQESERIHALLETENTAAAQAISTFHQNVAAAREESAAECAGLKDQVLELEGKLRKAQAAWDQMKKRMAAVAE